MLERASSQAGKFTDGLLASSFIFSKGAMGAFNWTIPLYTEQRNPSLNTNAFYLKTSVSSFFKRQQEANKSFVKNDVQVFQPGPKLTANFSHVTCHFSAWKILSLFPGGNWLPGTGKPPKCTICQLAQYAVKQKEDRKISPLTSNLTCYL